jgi:hypothetical protein
MCTEKVHALVEAVQLLFLDFDAGWHWFTIISIHEMQLHLSNPYQRSGVCSNHNGLRSGGVVIAFIEKGERSKDE